MENREEEMKCTFDKELLFEFAEGEITPEGRHQVESHLSECALCRAEVVMHRQLARDLGDLPEPVFPLALEDVLVRASIQARKNHQGTSRTLVVSRPRRLYWALGLGGLVGFGVLVLMVLLLWPGRISTWGPVDRVVGGGVGQGLGALDGILRWVSDLRAGWDYMREFLQKLAPVQRAARVALSGVGGPLWAALVLGLVGATLFLWRLTSSGQKKMRSMGHAKPQG
jgi:hypothetical protein